MPSVSLQTLAPAPTVPAKADVITAFSTPHKVLAWLLRAQEEGKRSVGRNGEAGRCPLARFAKTELGVKQPQVCHMVHETWGGSKDEGMMLRYVLDEEFDIYTRVRLPQWCQDFVLRVDAQKTCTISPKRALRILGEVITNREFANE